MTMCRIIEEPCNGKPLSTVLKTSEFRERLAEFTSVNSIRLGVSIVKNLFTL